MSTYDLIGLYPRKGSIAVGSDADFVVWDVFAQGQEKRLTNGMLHHAVDYTPYEGMKLGAWPGITVSRCPASGRVHRTTAIRWTNGSEAGGSRYPRQPC